MLGLAVAGNVEGGEKLVLAAVKADEEAAKLESTCLHNNNASLSLSLTHDIQQRF